MTECRIGGATGCVDLRSNTLHCGDCADAACSADQLCIAGDCRDFASAAPCIACPCDAVCDQALDGSNCCEIGGAAVCVDGRCP